MQSVLLRTRGTAEPGLGAVYRAGRLAMWGGWYQHGTCPWSSRFDSKAHVKSRSSTVQQHQVPS